MEHQFAFIPYLKTGGPVQYRGLTLFSSDDLAGLDTGLADHVRTLASMFFLRDDLRIEKVTCAVVEAADAAEMRRRVEDLSEFQSVVRYMYSAPHPIFGQPFLTSEHGSLFLFQPQRVSQYLLWSDHNVVRASQEPLHDTPDERHELAGYAGYLDGRSPLWVARGSRIYPLAAHFWLNISQDLHADVAYRVNQSSLAPVFHFLADPRRDPELAARILSALRWYNRSLAIDVHEDVALVSLAVAFESLLDLPRGREVTERFKQAVVLLLGPVVRLDSFLRSSTTFDLISFTPGILRIACSERSTAQPAPTALAPPGIVHFPPTLVTSSKRVSPRLSTAVTWHLAVDSPPCFALMLNALHRSLARYPMLPSPLVRVWSRQPT